MSKVDEKTGSDGLSRRGFLKLAGAVGAVPLLGEGAPVPPAAEAAAKEGIVAPQDAPLIVGKQALGKTGAQVSKLSLGMMFDTGSNLLLLRQAILWGVTYWDTADCYEGGDSEKGLGKYFKKFPDDRAKVFLVTKGDTRDAEGLSKGLEESLSRMNTTWIDLFYLHGIRGADELTPEVMAWAAEQKKNGKIKLFGFSTHANMAECLTHGATLDWIDAAMVKFDYRLMQDPEVSAAVEAFGKAGKGITVMKTQGGGPIKSDEADGKAAGHFLTRGFSMQQAKVMALWANPWVSSCCLRMKNLELLTTYVAAALDRVKLSRADWDALDAHARDTHGTTCAGCAARCEPNAEGMPIAEIMRLRMYAEHHGEPNWTREGLAHLRPDVLTRLASTDYRAAEAACPRGLPIARLVKDTLVRYGA